MMLLLLLAACSDPAPPTVVAPPPAPSALEVTHTRLSKTEGGRLLLQAIDGHGGLEPWMAAGSLAFDFDYAPVGAPEKRRYARTQADLRGRRAVQTELGEGADAKLGWDGQDAWIVPDASAFPSPPRFWATTPLYFVGLPWVLADPGTIHTVLPATVIPETGETRPLPTLKVTYEAGTGDAPDDFYVLHLDPDSKRILAVRYIVTFPAFFPEGGHSPEKVLLWSDVEEAGGLWFATHYNSHGWNGGDLSPLTTTVDVANIVLGDALPDAIFSAPAP